MDLSDKKVSIIIPVFNGTNYLGESIDSALNQTYPNIELIVVNDGSNDDGMTREIALSYRDKIRYFEKKNGGVASALNLGISEMKGDFFSWLSHDDLYHPNKIQSQLKTLKDLDPNKTIVVSNFFLINEINEIIGESKISPKSLNDVKFWLTTESELNGCTLLIPKPLLTNEYIFNEDLRYIQDYDLWFRLANKARFVLDSSCLVYSRQHSGQDTNANNKKVKEEINSIKSKFVDKLAIKPFSKKHRNLVQKLFKQGFYSAFIRSLIQPFRL